MVISLDETDKNNFVQFLKAIISSDGEKCAQKIYSLSNFDGKKIPWGKFNDYYLELKELFSVINGADLDDLDGMKLLGGMLSIIRNYRMKLDG
jgi:predicted unusual protein kinase regulating ubiquinone biosynthesis (AarF/ABC1/UbiB family)